MAISVASDNYDLATNYYSFRSKFLRIMAPFLAVTELHNRA